MSEPEEKYYQIDDNDDSNKEELYEQEQKEPFEFRQFFSGCFNFGFTSIFIMFMFVYSFANLFEYSHGSFPFIIILIVNFFSIRHYYLAGKKSYAYGIITETLLLLLLTGSCLLSKK